MNRRRRFRLFAPAIGPACAFFLVLVCFQGVLFRDEQFAYRDTATFYYPLYLRVQQAWEAHRWPLWEPGLNGGMPLLGMPMAAVLYPGKLVHAALGYAWASRLYTLIHVAIAWGGMFALCRAWRLTSVAAGLAALAYAFGAPVLFQYCNIIYLVGAAWLPWGFLALEWLLVRGRRWGLPFLAVVLALQVLGGDPQSAYVTLACGGGYALVLACWGAASASSHPSGPRPKWLLHARFGRQLAALAAGAALAMALAAAQILPAAEFARHTARTAGIGRWGIYGFDIEPYRLIEAVWPDAYGRFGPDNRSWIQAVPPVGERQLWTPSLYIGGLTLMLAASGMGTTRKTRACAAWPVALLFIGGVALAASFGRFAGPLWWARCLPGLAEVLGPHDPHPDRQRIDGYLPDGTGSVYGLLALLLPGFSLFRYPAKLLPVTVLAVSALAGRGWDRLALGRTRVPRRWCLAGLGITLVLLIAVLAARGPLVGSLSRRIPATVEFGPVDPPAAVAATVRGLLHGGAMLAVGLALAMVAPRCPRGAGVVALLVMALDLGAANAPLVWTVPQAALDAMPEVHGTIAAAESKRGDRSAAANLYRIHRMEMTAPLPEPGDAPAGRLRATVAWQRDTLEPLYGLPRGVQYTLFQGFLDHEDYVPFFASAPVTGLASGYAVSRWGMSLWNARYVILPVSSNGWMGGDAGSGLQRIAPADSVARDAEKAKHWIARHDWQLVRNGDAYPRAWLVHDVRVRKPIAGTSDPRHADLMQDLVYQALPAWRQPGRPTHDLRTVAFVETARPEAFAGAVSRTPPGPDEFVMITRYEPERVELVAQLERPGLVVLAEAFYPGWALEINGAPAPIYRTNRMMRGAHLRAGRHRLVFTYDPATFRVGRGLSVAGLLVLAGLVPWAIRQGSTRPRTGSAP
jgi:hypothetical protein